MRHLACKLGQCVGWNGVSLRRAQRCKPLRCFAQFRVEAANAETHQGGFHPVDDAGALANQLLALASRAFRILLFQCGNSGHAAVFLLAAQPTEQRPFEQPNIQPIGLRASPLPGDRNAGRMNDISFDPSTAQPTRQPEPITTRFKRDDQSGDRLASCNRLIAPAVQQREQSFLVGCQFFQRFSLDTRNHSAYQPSCGTEFDNRYQCLILLKGDEGPAEVIFRLRHGATPSSGCSDDGATPRRPPHSIYSRFSGIWPTASLPINHLLCENRRTQGRMGEVGLAGGPSLEAAAKLTKCVAGQEVTDVEGKTGIIVVDDDKLCQVKYADGEIYRWILWNLRPAAARTNTGSVTSQPGPRESPTAPTILRPSSNHSLVYRADRR